jgi:8-oxo-dGTP diphosphatase
MSPFTYEYARPAFTCDTVVVSGVRPFRRVLLIRRGEAPFAGLWAIPGGFVQEEESPERASRRELAEETGLVFDGDLISVGTFGNQGRDPRGWTVTAVYAAVAPSPPPEVAGGDDASEAAWFAEDALPLPLAFDHDQMVSAALARLDLESTRR